MLSPVFNCGNVKDEADFYFGTISDQTDSD